MKRHYDISRSIILLILLLSIGQYISVSHHHESISAGIHACDVCHISHSSDAGLLNSQRVSPSSIALLGQVQPLPQGDYSVVLYGWQARAPPLHL